MKNCDYLCSGIATTLEMALDKETDIKTGKILVCASRSYAQTYLNELKVIHGTGKEKLKTGGEEYFLLDLLVNFKEKNITFFKGNLVKLLKLDEDINFFVKSLMEPESKYATSWLELSPRKQEVILSAHKQAYTYHKKKWNKLANAQPVLQIKKPAVRKKQSKMLKINPL